MMGSNRQVWVALAALAVTLGSIGTLPSRAAETAAIQVTEDDQAIQVVTPHLELTIKKEGYVSGIAGGSFVDRATGFRDLGFGLDIADFLLEPGSDEAYRDQLPAELRYDFNNLYHGKRAKRLVEGPQICTQAKRLSPKVVRGENFVAIGQTFTYHLAAPERQTGSQWTQWIVVPVDRRYVFTMDRVDCVNESPALALRIDMPGHIRHRDGDGFDLVYLSYRGFFPSALFCEDFPPDEKFDYVRGRDPLPDRFIRAYRPLDASGRPGPWLAGMTLDPAVVSEAWCHQRGYVCMIEEIGGRSVAPGDSFSAAFIVGWFDNVGQMLQVYDTYHGARAIEVDETARTWRLIP
ncbi:MAG: hypothetical protein Kow0040_05680 [Thermogutta sp.]